MLLGSPGGLAGRHPPSLHLGLKRDMFFGSDAGVGGWCSPLSIYWNGVAHRRIEWLTQKKPTTRCGNRP